MTGSDLLTVGQVAERFGVTVRTLHHYDEIGLLAPSERSRAGYRLYTGSDLRRLALIVGYRRLELPLEEVAALLDGHEEPVAHLRRQQAVVLERLDRLRELARALDAAVEAEMNDRMTDAELRELFGGGFDESYAEEAQARWGDSEAWAQSTSRTKHYTRADWEAVKAEGDAVNAAFAAAMDAGLPADSPQALEAAAQHRASIERFYDCSDAMHRGLGDMYVADPRFRQTYDSVRPGMADYVRDAIHASVERRGQR